MTSRLVRSVLLGLLYLETTYSLAVHSKLITQNTVGCLTRDSPPSLAERELARTYNSKKSLVERSNIPVDTYFHVVYANTTVEGGYIPQERLDAQFEILKSMISTLGVDLIFKKTVWTENARYFSEESEINRMVRELRVGDIGTLNIFFQGAFLGGRASNPTDPANNPDVDYVLIHHRSLPGAGGIPAKGVKGYNQGKLAAHEVGHWLTLHHTFRFPGCDTGPEGNDLVEDTNPSSDYYQGCPDEPEFQMLEDYFRNTCGLGLPDPISNPMSYAHDRCMDNFFTPGQRARVQAMLPLYRGLGM